MTARVAVTTIIRRTPVAVPAGRLYVVGLETGEVVADAPLPDALHRARDRNPRGGLRGGRGVASAGDRLAVALNDRILILDPQWSVRDVISHRFVSGLHDIAADAGGVWATCADNDVVLRFAWDGRLLGAWTWRADRALRRELGYGWLPSFDRHVDHRDPYGGGVRVDIGHVNAIAPDSDAVLVLLGLLRPPPPLAWRVARDRALVAADLAGLGRAARSAVARWRASPLAATRRGRAEGLKRPPTTPGALRLEDALLADSDGRAVLLRLSLDLPRRGARVVARLRAGGMPAHNVVRLDSLLVLNDSSHGEVVAIDAGTGAVVRRVALSGELPFPRGLLDLGGGRVLVGRRDPNALEVVDVHGGRVEHRFDLGRDVDEAPYAIARVPDSFDDPVGRLPATRAAWGVSGGDARGVRRT
jgi:hypothetical protein